MKVSGRVCDRLLDGPHGPSLGQGTEFWRNLATECRSDCRGPNVSNTVAELGRLVSFVVGFWCCRRTRYGSFRPHQQSSSNEILTASPIRYCWNLSVSGRFFGFFGSHRKIFILLVVSDPGRRKRTKLLGDVGGSMSFHRQSIGPRRAHSQSRPRRFCCQQILHTS
jgi:hypothetical protein